MFRKTADILTLVAVIAVGAYLWNTHPAEVKGVARIVENAIAPCARPLTYSIGFVDPRFRIATSALVSDLLSAESAWEKPSGKDLFEYVESGGNVTVSLVYDQRQASTDMLRSAGISIDRSKANYETLKLKYDDLASQIDAEQARYENDAAAYKSRESAYNDAVSTWNARGGAPPSEYRRLAEEKQALSRDFSALKDQERSINAHVDTANALATTINQLIVQLNLNVAQYNRAGAAAGEFEEGVYQLQGGVQTIDIFEYSDRLHLIRVLAHEMGHAIGLDHVEDPAAIMYQVNAGDDTVAKSDDLAELRRVCRISS